MNQIEVLHDKIRALQGENAALSIDLEQSQTTLSSARADMQAWARRADQFRAETYELLDVIKAQATLIAKLLRAPKPDSLFADDMGEV